MKASLDIRLDVLTVLTEPTDGSPPKQQRQFSGHQRDVHALETWLQSPGVEVSCWTRPGA